MGYSDDQSTRNDYFNLMMINAHTPTYRHQCPQLFYNYTSLVAEERGGFNTAQFDGTSQRWSQQVVVWRSENLTNWEPVTDQGFSTHTVSVDEFDRFKIKQVKEFAVFEEETSVGGGILSKGKDIPKGAVIVSKEESDGHITFTVQERHWPDEGQAGVPGAFVSLIDLDTNQDLTGDIYFRSQMIHVPGAEYPFVLWVNHLPKTEVLEKDPSKDNLIEFYFESGYLIGKSKHPAGPFRVVRQLKNVQRYDGRKPDYGLADFSLFRDKDDKNGYVAYGSWGSMGQNEDSWLWDAVAFLVFDIPSFFKNRGKEGAQRHVPLPHNAIANGGHVIQVKKLSEDCTDVVDVDGENPYLVTKDLDGNVQAAREAPAEIYHNGMYWLFSGHTSCFNRRGSNIQLYVSLDLKEWTTMHQYINSEKIEFDINPEFLFHEKPSWGVTGKLYPANPYQIPGQVNSIVSEYDEDGQVFVFIFIFCANGVATLR